MVDNTTLNTPSPNGIAVLMQCWTMKRLTSDIRIRTRTSQAQVMVITDFTRNVIHDHPQTIFKFYGEIVKLNFVNLSPTPIAPSNALMQSS